MCYLVLTTMITNAVSCVYTCWLFSWSSLDAQEDIKAGHLYDVDADILS